MPAVGRIEDVDAPLVNVDEDQDAAIVIPQRPFAELRSGVENEFGLQSPRGHDRASAGIVLLPFSMRIDTVTVLYRLQVTKSQQFLL